MIYEMYQEIKKKSRSFHRKILLLLYSTFHIVENFLVVLFIFLNFHKTPSSF